MAFLVWEDKYSVGIKEIDDQHKGLFDIINDLYEAIKLNKNKEILSDIINKLVKYTEVHFDAEELLMSLYKYPDLEEHKRLHGKFTSKVIEFRDNFNPTTLMTSLEVMEFLKQWWMHHVLDTDKQYSPFLLKKGLR